MADVASTYGFEMTVSTVIRRAMQVAGLLEASATPNADDLAMGRDLLQMELDELQTVGDPQRTIERTTKALVASTAEYTLDADCIDVLVAPDNAAGTVYVTASDGETRVFIMSRAEYQGLSNKDSEGTPTRVLIEKGDTITATFWPVPSETMTFSYSKLRFPRDATLSNRPDVDRRRLAALVWSLAYAIASTKAGMPLNRLQELKDERNRRKAVAMRDDTERGHGQLVVR